MKEPEVTVGQISEKEFAVVVVVVVAAAAAAVAVVVAVADEGEEN